MAMMMQQWEDQADTIYVLQHRVSLVSAFYCNIHLLQSIAKIVYDIYVESLNCFCTTTEDWKSPRIGLLGLANEQIQGFLIHPRNVSELIMLHTYIM